MGEDNLGRPVTWQDGNGNVHTGRVVTKPIKRDVPPYGLLEVAYGADDHFKLVMDAEFSALVWVASILLKDKVTR